MSDTSPRRIHVIGIGAGSPEHVTAEAAATLAEVDVFLVADKGGVKDELVAVRRGERKVLSVPVDFLGEDGPLPELAGTFTVLSDNAFDDEEIVEWMFAHDETLPGGPTPIAAIRAGFKTEVRRRAMEEA